MKRADLAGRRGRIRRPLWPAPRPGLCGTPAPSGDQAPPGSTQLKTKHKIVLLFSLSCDIFCKLQYLERYLWQVRVCTRYKRTVSTCIFSYKGILIRPRLEARITFRNLAHVPECALWSIQNLTALGQSVVRKPQWAWILRTVKPWQGNRTLDI